MAESFHPVARVSDIPKKQCRSFRVGESDVVVAHTADGFYAVEDLCTHAEARLSQGRVKRCRIVCPLHGAAFDLRDGRVVKGPAIAPVRCYPVRVVGDTLEVGVT
ncbi:MAG: Rieske 2Fe-2S domain-containing protein [Gammaproteobacteria bacterium]|jgi:3-phenylpropionate/trans-cinnamate dioxygenase ferredoxin subunit|nr:Rieske 2Fe-2S domain-containing protein [Gammaproteobacteria bacterium]